MNGGGNIIAASHTIELARRWGRRVRNLIVEHSPTLLIALADDSTAAERWSLQNGIEYYAAGVGTGIAGFRGKLGLIDDPVRSREDAEFANEPRQGLGLVHQRLSAAARAACGENPHPNPLARR